MCETNFLKNVWKNRRISPTATGSGSFHRPDRITDIVGATKVNDPPMTVGNLVPNKVCSNVFNPATKSRVWITLAFSSYNNGKCGFKFHYIPLPLEKKTCLKNLNYIIIFIGLTFPPPIWGTRAVGMITVVPSITMKCWNPSRIASAASQNSIK